MPRLKAIVHPFYGQIAVRSTECPSCGAGPGETCYFICPNSPVCYTPEREKADALAFDALSDAEVERMHADADGVTDCGHDPDVCETCGKETVWVKESAQIGLCDSCYADWQRMQSIRQEQFRSIVDSNDIPF